MMRVLLLPLTALLLLFASQAVAQTATDTPVPATATLTPVPATATSTPTLTRTPSFTPTCGINDRRAGGYGSVASLCNATCASPPCDGTPIPANNALFGEIKTVVGFCYAGSATFQTFCREGSGYFAGTPIAVGTPVQCGGTPTPGIKQYTSFSETFQDCFCEVTVQSSWRGSCTIDRDSTAVKSQ